MRKLQKVGNFNTTWFQHESYLSKAIFSVSRYVVTTGEVSLAATDSAEGCIPWISGGSTCNCMVSRNTSF